MSLTSPFSTPAWIDAPAATASSGLTPLCASLPVSSCTRSATAGMRVLPPTRITWSIFDLSRPASLIACSNGPRHASSRSRVISWKRDRVSERSRCNGPSVVAVMNGRLTVVSWRFESSILAFSAASFSRCVAILSFARSMPCAFLNSVTSQSMTRWSQSSPPRCVLPDVRLHLEHAVADLEHRHVERAAAEVEDEDRLVVAFLVEAVRERGRGGLVDDAQHFEARDLTGLLGGLALGVVEVRGHGDDGLVHGLAEVALGVALQLHAGCGR